MWNKSQLKLSWSLLTFSMITGTSHVTAPAFVHTEFQGNCFSQDFIPLACANRLNWKRRLFSYLCFSLCNQRGPRRYCTSEDLSWCISDYTGHSLLSYIEWSRLLHASPVSCASTYPCRAKIQSEIPHRALSSCLHPFWRNLHFSLAICGFRYMSPFQASLPQIPVWLTAILIG